MRVRVFSLPSPSPSEIANIEERFGQIYVDLYQYELANKHLFHAIDLYKQIEVSGKRKMTIAAIYERIAENYLLLNQIDTSIEHFILDVNFYEDSNYM